MLYGLMTEEINHSYDGGLYAELIANRTFRPTWDGIQRWTLVRRGEARGKMAADRTDGPSQALNTSVKLTVESASAGNEAGMSNLGYWGVPVKPHTAYRGSFYAKLGEGSVGPMTVQLVSDKMGAVLAHTQVDLHPGAWSRYEFSMTSGAAPASLTNHVEFLVSKPGTISMQLVSLMPPTYHDRQNGNRIDLMQHMADLHPHFLRMPGGNYLEGNTMKDWYNWKETVGPLVDRPGHQAPWSYWSSDGLGLLEYLEWCEDLHIEPVLAVYAGFSLHGEYAKPGKDLEPYVQAALDEVEFVTGDANTKWGAVRAKNGHPAPFPLHYIEIGNEDNFDKSGSYPERFAQFARAIRQKYSQYKLISTIPLKDQKHGEEPDIQDDHYYKQSGDMLDFVHHYDNEPRTGPKIFVGEWATLSGSPTPDFGAALGDAAWMTAMERNSDLIIMSAYAPMLVNVNPQASQWGTNLIGYDALTSYVSPSFYAQSLFAGHIGDGTAKSSISGEGNHFFYSATVDSKTHILHLKLVNASSSPQPLSLEIKGAGSQAAKMTTLHAASFEATNSITDPNFIHPVDGTLQISGASQQHTVPAYTIEVIDVHVR
jgi:alpha-L-arabinofuranosidase